MESENQRVKFLDVGHGDSSVIYLNMVIQRMKMLLL